MTPVAAEQVRERCEQSLRDEADLRGVGETLRGQGVTAEESVGIVGAAATSGDQGPIRRLKDTVASAVGEGHALERFLLLHTALAHLDQVSGLPVSEDVKRRFGAAFSFFADPADRRWRANFEVGGSSFLSLCKLATLRRFPAGEWEWEVSGLPRSWLMQVAPTHVPRLAMSLLTLGGFSPLVFPHLGVLRPKRIMLVEKEINRSYYQIASSVERQPSIRGLIASAWFFAPAAYESSPHLSWLATFFQNNGGSVIPMKARRDHGSVSRNGNQPGKHDANAASDAPMGLVLWPREQMLSWAAAHPELGG